MDWEYFPPLPLEATLTESIRFLESSFLPVMQEAINPIALRKVKIVDNFGLSDCNRAKDFQLGWLPGEERENHLIQNAGYEVCMLIY